MNCGLRHFGNILMQLSYRQASICANFSFSFLKKVPRDQSWPTAPLFVLNISPSFGEFTVPLEPLAPYHLRWNFPSEMFLFSSLLLIHNVTINSNNLFVNFRWTFKFALRNRMTERTSHLAGLWIGTAISNTSHSNKVDSTTVKRARLTGKWSRSTAVLP